jgi:DNA ligase 1
MLLADVVATSAAVAATRSRKQKVAALADRLAQMSSEEVEIGARYLAGLTTQDRLDVGWRLLGDIEVAPAAEATLTLTAVDAALEELTTISGTGARSARRALLERLLGVATVEEQVFLRGLMLGELRQGALAGIVAQAIAAAWDVPEPAVRRALLLHADVGAVAAAAQGGGVGALDAFRLELFRPLAPMLASTSAGVGDAMEGLSEALVEHKLDGARIQVHRRGDDIAIYTRNLRDITARVPDVTAAVQALPVTSVVLDGEVLVLRDDGRPLAFAETMSRFGSDDAEALAAAAALRPFFFDVIHLDGEDLLDEPLARRREALVHAAPDARIPGRVVGSVAEADAVLTEALDAGHEGVMVKTLTAPYEAGRRGSAWRKVKPVHTLDLVVLAVEWGSGRRRGWLSNLHLGARDPDGGGFVMLGKTFKGMTDAMLQWQTERFLALETGRDGHIVHVRPEQVVEIAVDGVQASSRYPGGVTLRFARVKRYRDDKTAGEADTLDAVRALRRG